MIKHIVLWRFLEMTKDGDKQQNLLHAQNLLLAMKDKIEGIIDLHAGINLMPVNNCSDLALSITFADKSALQKYQYHPVHIEVKQFLAGVRYERRVIDYEI